MMADGERAECPDCGRDYAVNKDGSIRAHDCDEQATPAVEETEQGDAVLVGEHGPELVEFEQPTRVVASRKDPRLCAVAGCDRPNVLHRLCGAHYASRRGDGR